MIFNANNLFKKRVPMKTLSKLETVSSAKGEEEKKEDDENGSSKKGRKSSTANNSGE